jgi:hypothetical protein
MTCLVIKQGSTPSTFRVAIYIIPNFIIQIKYNKVIRVSFGGDPEDNSMPSVFWRQLPSLWRWQVSLKRRYIPRKSFCISICVFF